MVRNYNTFITYDQGMNINGLVGGTKDKPKRSETWIDAKVKCIKLRYQVTL